MTKYKEISPNFVDGYSVGNSLMPKKSDLDLDLEADRLHEECGVFGVHDISDAAAHTVLGLHALQHRGQEAVGIVSFSKKKECFYSIRKGGLVGDRLANPKAIKKLKGRSAIGHVRYSTTGESIYRNIQPLFAEINTGGFAICHNGNLTNAQTLRKSLIKKGAIFQSTSDSEVILHLLAKSKQLRILDRFTDALNQIEGAFSMVALSNKKMIGVRDRYGIRPLILGKLNGKWILTSESCALDIMGATFVRDIENGEMVVITDDNIEPQSFKPFGNHPHRPCVFEYVYFSRPDSVVNGLSVYNVRKNMGFELAKESPIDADVVIPIPDSGVPAAIGYAQEAKIPFELGIIRNHYVGRTFIQPTQAIRDIGVKKKHNPVRSVVEGKKIILIDDSIVRGTTSKKIVQLMRDAGAAEVHLRVSSPPIKHPDFYGIDTPDKENLIASSNSDDEIAEIINADSVKFLSINGLYKALGYKKRNDAMPQLTDHCFTGDYPTRLKDKDDFKENQPSLFREDK